MSTLAAVPGDSRAPMRKLPGPNLSSITLKLDKDDPTPKEMRRWQEAQVAYPNLAGDRDIADRAKLYIQTIKRQYADQMHAVWQQWETSDYMLKGNSLSNWRSDVHVPQLFKAIEVLVPRIEEALLGPRQWFSPSGRRTALQEAVAAKIRQWIRYQLDRAGFERLKQPSIRDALQYGFFCIKVWWDWEFQARIVREVEEIESSDGMPMVRISRKEMQKLVYEGIRLKLLSPWDVIADTEHPNDVMEMAYIGDSTMLAYEEIARLGESGRYLNWQELEKTEPESVDGDRMFGPRRPRATTGATDGTVPRQRAPGGQRFFRVDEVWCRWSPYDGAPAEEYILTVAQDKVVLRVQQNPHDDRHRPYAMGRITRDARTWPGIAPINHAIPLAIELDDTRNLLLKWGHNSICPPAIVDTSSDLPNNIFDRDPGTLIRAQLNQGGVQFIKPPSTLSDAVAMESILKKDIEEVTGAPQLYMGTANTGDDTATETVTRQQEANRRLVGPVSGVADGMAQMLRIVYALSAQYSTRRTTYPVMGEDAGFLGPHTDIGPQDFGEEVDFIFPGVSELQSMGLRATQFITYAQASAPWLIPLIQMGLVNLPELNWQMAKASFGDSPMVEAMFQRPKSLLHMDDPDLENMRLLAGQDAGVHELDDDERHLRSHLRARQGPKFATSKPSAQKALDEHIAQHGIAQKRKAARKAAQDQQAAAFQRPPGAQEQNGAMEDAMARPASTGKGRNGRSPDIFGSAFPGSPGGETPGPPRAGAVPAADRQPSTPQSENRMGA